GDGTAHYAFSNNGLLAYVEGTAFDEECTLVWRDRNGEESVLLDEPAVYLEPKLSPDNQRIVTKVDSDAGIDIW
ncbi:MAG: hypothetical protein GWN46_26490, partial [Gammaproteobacteria bacterium]|nr:hypothetical protein [Xanthomonadales bacterium]NIV50090.1 hypothetical protein [Gammaproteobacteria bacterium]NIX14030.1 hypothetical protein [Xanthomonadales bacterium]